MSNERSLLSKSRYLSGLQCARRLWLGRHGTDLATPAGPEREAIFALGHEIGRHAHALFPGGVLVSEEAWRHDDAIARTRELLGDPSVSALFEAAFEHAGVRIRVDVLERLPGGAFGLREVKAAAALKDIHLPDVAVQRFVLEGAGLRVPSVELVHVNRDYVRREDGIDWLRFFERVDVTREVDALRARVPEQVAAMRAVLERSAPPAVEPSPHCFSPYECEFWAHCTRQKPKDWILHLPHLREPRFSELRALGVERIPDIPDGFPLSAAQARVRDVLRSGRPFVSPDLPRALQSLGPPALYLDFETVSPAIPIWPGTRPFERIPFQFSLHRVGPGRGAEPTHREFLAEGRGDPRRALAKALLEAAGSGSEPILVYSLFEAGVLGELARAVPDLAEPLGALRLRLGDLLAVVRSCVYEAAFGGSFSIKDVAPVLVPGLRWDDLAAQGVADGAAASAAFLAILGGSLGPVEEERLRAALRSYCARDTLALVRLHAALLARARS